MRKIHHRFSRLRFNHESFRCSSHGASVSAIVTMSPFYYALTYVHTLYVYMFCCFTVTGSIFVCKVLSVRNVSVEVFYGFRIYFAGAIIASRSHTYICLYLVESTVFVNIRIVALSN